MNRRYKKLSLVTGIVTTCLLLFIFIAYKMAPGMDPYSESYEFEISSKQLVKIVQNFKKENPQYATSVTDHYDPNYPVTLYFHSYVYLPDENLIFHFWITNDREKENRSYLNLVGVNEGLQLLHWSQINEDFSRKENRRLLTQFENKVLKKVMVPYINKGNNMFVF